MTNNHSDREHAELSLSSSDRWVNCPGSVFLARNIPKSPPGKAALKGTHQHELCEVVLKDFLNHKVCGYDPELNAKALYANYDEEGIENAKAYRDAVWEVLLDQTITGKAWGIEERFVFDSKLQIFGTTDFWSIYLDSKGKRAATVCDYKDGFDYVDVKSGQLKSYAATIRREIRAAGKDLDYVKVAIFQPRCPSADALRTAILTAKALDTWEKKMVKAAHQVYVKQKPTFKVGDWCKWCPAKAVCKKYGDNLQKETSLKMVDPDKIVLPAVETYTPEQLAKIVLHGDELTNYVDTCKKYALNLQLNGSKLPGVKAVLGSTRRSWIEDEGKVVDSLVGMGLSEALVYQKPKLATLTSIEKKVGKGKIDHLTKQSEPKPVLVPLSDPRVEIKDGLSLLGEITEDDE